MAGVIPSPFHPQSSPRALARYHFHRGSYLIVGVFILETNIWQPPARSELPGREGERRPEMILETVKEEIGRSHMRKCRMRVSLVTSKCVGSRKECGLRIETKSISTSFINSKFKGSNWHRPGNF
jgi:hypothetical protein